MAHPSMTNPDLHILKLLGACCRVFNNSKYRPRGGLTFCNQAVNEISTIMGWHDFEGMLANEIMAKVKKDIGWRKVNSCEAQIYANCGELVIAGQRMDPQGHVVVIFPGFDSRSGKWKKEVPLCVNIGKDYEIGRGVNWAFAEKEPEYWYWAKGYNL